MDRHSTSPALVIHGHFYQPPRENPWTEMVDRETSAAPFENWNERIHDECYRPNAHARIFDAYGRVERIVNNYAGINFNFGPTLLTWLARHHPETYARILEADRTSTRVRGGHGNAIAQGYHHAILPLCNARDRRTEIRWGLADFRHRYQREPEALWLPETACDDLTLAALIEEGLRYVILSPFQAERVRPLSEHAPDPLSVVHHGESRTPHTSVDPHAQWRSVADGNIDPTIPYRYFHPDGSRRAITIFFYDGHIARAIAFEGALASSQGLVDHLARASRGAGRIVHTATDGESYGHHFHFGDRTIAYALETEARARGFWVTNYGEFLDHHAPTWEVEIKKGPDGEGTAWSCAHGVGRWRRDCSCHAGALEGWNQKWRAPLRAALEFLRDAAAQRFEEAGGELFRDVWEARDRYIELIVDPARARTEFWQAHSRQTLSTEEQTRALTLLEMQRSSLLTFTSCGWFFNDISGLETLQVLRYAGRVLDCMDELKFAAPHQEFLEILAEARSNVARQGSGADIFRRAVETSRITAQHVAAHLAIAGLVNHGEETNETAGYLCRREDLRKERHGRLTMETARLTLEKLATGKLFDFAVAAMHFGDVDFYCVLKSFPGEAPFQISTAKLWSDFRTASLPTMLRLAQEEFGPDEYGLEHLLSEGRQRISEMVFGKMVERFSEAYASLYEDNRRNIEMLHQAGFELPRELRAAAEFTMGRKFETEMRLQQQHEPPDYRPALKIAHEVAQHGYRIRRDETRRMFQEMIARAVRQAVADPAPENLQTALTLITLAKELKLDANVERAQEFVYQAIEDNVPDPQQLHDLAALLGLSPNLSQPMTSATDSRPTRRAAIQANQKITAERPA